MKGTTVTLGRRLRADTASSTARLAAGAGVKNPSGTGKHAQVHAETENHTHTRMILQTGRYHPHPHHNYRQIHSIGNEDHGADMSFQAEARHDDVVPV